MNFTENFEQFASKVSSMDLALYAGVGLVLWVLFKDKLSPVQKAVLSMVENLKGLVGSRATPNIPVMPVATKPVLAVEPEKTEDLFFKLVVSWKQTRDLAVRSGCSEAVKVADQMFPFLSPTVCGPKEDKVL
jgi:hypothetical protein